MADANRFERGVDRRRVPSDERKIYEPKKLWDQHHEIMRRIVLGQNNTQISQAMGISSQTVSNLRNSPFAQARLSEMRAARDMGTIDIAKEIREAAPKALKLVIESLDDEQLSLRDKLKQANLLLDRAGYAPVKQVQAMTTNLSLTATDIDELKQRAIAAAMEDGCGIVDVTAVE